jgi:hypothetical protein
MGHVRTTLTVTHRVDQARAERGVIRPEEVRTVTLENVMVDTGAMLLAWTEMWFGACRDARHLAVVLLGTRVGAALFNDGVHYRGSTSSAGGWGQSMDQNVNMNVLHV